MPTDSCSRTARPISRYHDSPMPSGRHPAPPSFEVDHPAGRQVSPSFPNINSCVVGEGYNTCRKGAPHLLPHLSDGL
jgi:hypothetical protein